MEAFKEVREHKDSHVPSFGLVHSKLTERLYFSDPSNPKPEPSQTSLAHIAK